MLLHITNDYSGSKVYKNLVQELDKLGLIQFVYHPLRETSLVGSNNISLVVKESAIVYSNILDSTLDRIFYHRKIRKIVRDIESKVELDKVTMIHAHTWYSDGGVAFLLSKKYGIPYILAVRSTDLNVFHKYMFHLRKYGNKILNEAEKIIFVGASYKEKLLNTIVGHVSRKLLSTKMQIIPNGVDQIFIEKRGFEITKADSNAFKLIYVGSFIRRKRIDLLMQAVKNLVLHKNINIQLDIIGGGGLLEDKVVQQSRENPNIFMFHGKINDKVKLIEHYKNADAFTLPSKGETFGLVYIEALLNGLPVLYTSNEGIDGFFKYKIGEKVKNGTVHEIENSLETLILNYESYFIPIEEIAHDFNWRSIALNYMNLYKQIIDK